MKTVIMSRAGIWGGLEAHAFGLARQLLESGHDVVIVCLDEETYQVYDRVVQGRVPLECLRHTKPVRQRNIRDWLRLFGNVPADVCVYEKGTLHSGSLSLEIAARLRYRRFFTIEQLEPMPLPEVPSKHYLFGLIPGLGLWWYRLRYAGWLRSLAPHRVITVSNSVGAILHRDYCFSKRKMLTIWNGADVDRFRPDPGLKLAARANWGIGEDALVFGSVRRFNRDKGLDLAIEAFRQFHAAHPDRDSYLVLIGDGPEREALTRQAEEAGIRSRVLFPGFTKEPWTVYPGFDVFVMPSRTEALSLALAEAMACGCIPIATDIGGSSEVITDASLGWIVTPESTAALKHAMSVVSDLPAVELEAFRSRVRKRVIENFNASAQYSKIIKVLEHQQRVPIRSRDETSAMRVDRNHEEQTVA